jgi:hypothetical protein
VFRDRNQLALAPVEDKGITPETAASLESAPIRLSHGESIPHEKVRRELGLSQ